MSELRDVAPFVLRNIQRRMEMEGLWRFVGKVPLVTADRIFFEADKRLPWKLEAGVYEDRFVESPSTGGPHRMVYSLFASAPGVWGRQRSWRSFSKPSLQVTLTWKEAQIFGDADLDLGNPLADVVGAIVHLFELLTPGKTDHRKLEEKVAKEWRRWRDEQRS